jgi:hypothetical protein
VGDSTGSKRIFMPRGVELVGTGFKTSFLDLFVFFGKFKAR